MTQLVEEETIICKLVRICLEKNLINIVMCMIHKLQMKGGRKRRVSVFIAKYVIFLYLFQSGQIVRLHNEYRYSSLINSHMFYGVRDWS